MPKYNTEDVLIVRRGEEMVMVKIESIDKRGKLYYYLVRFLAFTNPEYKYKVGETIEYESHRLENNNYSLSIATEMEILLYA